MAAAAVAKRRAGQAGPDRAPDRTGPSRAEPDRTGPGRPVDVAAIAMCCRARQLLAREYREYRAARLFGIFTRPLQDSVLEWVAEVQGLKDSLWEGAVLQLTLTYSEKYNDVPPTVRFNTIPFHPNGMDSDCPKKDNQVLQL
ncbi:ubiquitin-conjugating enzyme E2 U-like [Nothoprocta perdicaria]|uniref:ubiquitin-conjugating enzyme E2 U-like n=1 Tax=Nothoprocta perdicaria TaxID=30464 RepID=UPI000E1B5F44|nr:ubiquitin-conjugating enzyme E2 U-like [Nothoprocta perdicaria]